MYQIILHRRAASFYNKLSDKQKNRISKAIDKLKDNPLYDRDIKKLRGKLRGKHRLKMGPFRIVYLVDKERNRVIKEDFYYKIGIVLREARESNYWLRVLKASEIVHSQELERLIQESAELKKIFGSIFAKSRKL